MRFCSDIIRDGGSTSIGKIASEPYTKENGVAPIGFWILVRYAQRAGFNCRCQSRPTSLTVFLRIFRMVLFVALSWSFPWG